MKRPFWQKLNTFGHCKKSNKARVFFLSRRTFSMCWRRNVPMDIFNMPMLKRRKKLKNLRINILASNPNALMNSWYICSARLLVFINWLTKLYIYIDGTGQAFHHRRAVYFLKWLHQFPEQQGAIRIKHV